IHLKQADEIKSRFLSNMSHEFRTPLNSILALARILLDRLDGNLTAEQEKQITYISRSAEDLLTLVNDLLDLAKAEAGKLTARASTFEMKEVFGALRGLLKPLLTNERVALVIEEPVDIPALYTDESKVSQILRNFVSNALKFTECGEIRLFAQMTSDRQAVILSVSDTGIGIASEHQKLIFEEFTQLHNPLHKKVRGTGLGLPLAKRLAELLGGTISVKSELGVGSTFSVRIPLCYSEPFPEPPNEEGNETLSSILVVAHEENSLEWEDLRASGFDVTTAQNLNDLQQKLARLRPKALVVDIPPGQDGTKILTEVKGVSSLREIPILALVETVEEEARARVSGANACCAKPVANK